MRIISKFRDYYDGVVVYGSDAELCYVRDTRELGPSDTEKFDTLQKSVDELYGEMNVALERTWVWGNRRRKARPALCTDNFSAAIIGFCGKLYPAIQFYDEWLTHPNQFTDVLEKLRTDVLSFDGHYERSISLVEYQDYKKQFESPSITEKVYFRRSIHKFTREWFENFVAKHKAGKKVPLDFFFELNAPVFVWMPKDYKRQQQQKIIVNPQLKSYRFQSLVDPFSAWQELSMFVGGVLKRPETKMVAVSDEIRRDKMGFDERSFKNMQRKD